MMELAAALKEAQNKSFCQSLRGAKRRGNPEVVGFADILDCFASLAMTALPYTGRFSPGSRTGPMTLNPSS
jgi:hypothetical protein